MKIKISELEKKLDKKIKRHVKIIGLDTAKISGICFIRTDIKFLNLDWCKLEFNYNNQEEMLAVMYREFGQLFGNEDLAIVEEIFVGFNRVGSLRLAKMGTLAIAQCLNKKINFKLISATSARSKFFVLNSRIYKGRTKQAVLDYLRTIGIETYDTDVADAIILALCGICEGIDFKPKTKKKKKRKRKK